MEYTTLGEMVVEVSRICLGCTSFGDFGWRDWMLDFEEPCEPVRVSGHE